jgi:hypothetical protein
LHHCPLFLQALAKLRCVAASQVRDADLQALANQAGKINYERDTGESEASEASADHRRAIIASACKIISSKPLRITWKEAACLASSRPALLD